MIGLLVCVLPTVIACSVLLLMDPALLNGLVNVGDMVVWMEQNQGSSLGGCYN
jgi:hypothetical protein